VGLRGRRPANVAQGLRFPCCWRPWCRMAGSSWRRCLEGRPQGRVPRIHPTAVRWLEVGGVGWQRPVGRRPREAFGLNAW